MCYHGHMMNGLLGSLYKKSSTFHGALLFFLGALCATLAILIGMVFTSSKAPKSVPSVFSSSDECESATGEACFLHDCTPEICPANFQKGWMAQGVIAGLPTASSTPSEIDTAHIAIEIEQTVPETLSDKQSCSSNTNCSDEDICIAEPDGRTKFCHRACETDSDCASLHEEGACTAEKYCSLPMIEEE